MTDDIIISNLVSDIVAEKQYSHCRLCLSVIQEQYVRFTDTVSVDPEKQIFQPLNQILPKLLDNNVWEEVPGFDAVCTACVDKALEAVRFIELCQKSTNLIDKVFSNLSDALNIHIDKSKRDKALFIVVEENQSKLIWMKIEEERRENRKEKEEKRKEIKREKEEKRRKIDRTKHHFECYECDKLIHSFFDFKAHNLTHHYTFTCDKCYVQFQNDAELASHKRKSHNKLKCSECSQYRDTEKSLREHQEKMHSILVCQECGKPCQGIDNLRIHEEKHNIKFACPKCNKRYTTSDYYIKHVRLCLEDRLDPHPTRSNIKKNYTCEKCAKAYSTPGGLRVHNRFVHGNAKPHICKMCGKQFTAPSYLKNHMIKHTGEKNFICDLCGSRFVTKEALLYHTRRHTGEKPYTCKFCNERFVNASARAEHIKFKHIGPTLMCEICPRKFVTSYFLKQHISRHHDPSSKLYYGRNMIPPNMPGEQNMRSFKIKLEK